MVLAAGLSSRLAPDHKLLARLGGAPVIARTLGGLRDAGLEAITLVVGHRGDEVAEAARGAGVAFAVVRAADPSSGLGASLAAGIASLADPPPAGALVALGDMPLVRPSTIAALVAGFEAARDPGAIVRPCLRGVALNPVVWGRSHFAALAGLGREHGDRGGRALIAGAGASNRLVPTDDEGVALDLDDAAAFARAERLLRARAAGGV